MKADIKALGLILLGVSAFFACTPKESSSEGGILCGISDYANIEPCETVLLYPKGQDEDCGITIDGTALTLGPIESNGLSGNETVSERGNIGNVTDSARLIIYLPEKRNGQMVVICPGGGYANLAMGHEGYRPAEWFAARGIASAILVYRMPNGHDRLPLRDVQNAFRYCRARSSEWGIDQIGVMGFSAGGHLAATASTLYTDSCTRPDFSILIYPVVVFDDFSTHRGTFRNLTGGNVSLADHYSAEKHIDSDTPPAFLVSSANDAGVPPLNNYLYLTNLTAAGGYAEMYVAPRGKHGWGFKNGEDDHLGKSSRQNFYFLLDNFLKTMRGKEL